MLQTWGWAPRPVLQHPASETPRPWAGRSSGTWPGPACFPFESGGLRLPVKVGRQQSLVGSPQKWPRAAPSPGTEAQRTGEAENPRLNRQLETVRFNQQRGLAFPPASSITASVLESAGQRPFSSFQCLLCFRDERRSLSAAIHAPAMCPRGHAAPDLGRAAHPPKPGGGRPVVLNCVLKKNTQQYWPGHWNGPGPSHDQLKTATVTLSIQPHPTAWAAEARLLLPSGVRDRHS